LLNDIEKITKEKIGAKKYYQNHMSSYFSWQRMWRLLHYTSSYKFHDLTNCL